MGLGLGLELANPSPSPNPNLHDDVRGGAARLRTQLEQRGGELLLAAEQAHLHIHTYSKCSAAEEGSGWGPD